MRLSAKSVALGFCLVVLGLILHGSAPVGAKEKPKTKKKVELKVKIGDSAPSFESVDDMGKPFKSSEVVGKKTVVLFFYASDFSGNAVAQVRGFQEEIDTLDKAGAVLVGVSGDAVSTHKLFKAYYKLPFTLLADEKGDVAKAFGVPVGKGGKSPTLDAQGKKGEADRAITMQRWTIVIDKAGKVAAIDAVPPPIKGASVSNDGKRVAEIVKKLASK